MGSSICEEGLDESQIIKLTTEVTAVVYRGSSTDGISSGLINYFVCRLLNDSWVILLVRYLMVTLYEESPFGRDCGGSHKRW